MKDEKDVVLALLKLIGYEEQCPSYYTWSFVKQGTNQTFNVVLNFYYHCINYYVHTDHNIKGTYWNPQLGCWEFLNQNY